MKQTLSCILILLFTLSCGGQTKEQSSTPKSEEPKTGSCYSEYSHMHNIIKEQIEEPMEELMILFDESFDITKTHEFDDPETIREIKEAAKRLIEGGEHGLNFQPTCPKLKEAKENGDILYNEFIQIGKDIIEHFDNPQSSKTSELKLIDSLRRQAFSIIKHLDILNDSKANKIL